MRGLICDDHPLMRAALAETLRTRWPEISLQVANDFPSAWALAETQPDFCLVDLSMPGAQPLDGLLGIRARAPDAVVFVVTGLHDAADLEAAASCGVAGVFSKNADPERLLEAFGACVPGLHAYEAGRLPPRQRQVLGLIAEGRTNKEIAKRLGISPATVKVHVKRLSAWLGAANRGEAVAHREAGSNSLTQRIVAGPGCRAGYRQIGLP